VVVVICSGDHEQSSFLLLFPKLLFLFKLNDKVFSLVEKQIFSQYFIGISNLKDNLQNTIFKRLELLLLNLYKNNRMAT